jgi:hypothetical protein
MSDLKQCLEAISAASNSDMFLFCGSIDIESSDAFIKKIRQRLNSEKRRENCGVILTTFGGDPDAGYRIVRAIKRYYKKLTVYVFGACKSTGTLMSLGADEIVMSDFGEFGPLDIQLTKEDELLNTSGLSYLQSLTSLSDQIYNAFEKNFLNVLQKSGYSITTKTAAEISSKLAIGLISPISAQIDPIRLGEVHRAITIANQYGDRLSLDNSNIIAKLIVGYPSHGFVIDYEEARTIFKNVRWVKGEEVELERILLDNVRKETAEVLIIDLMDIIYEQPKIAADPVAAVPQNGEGGNGEVATQPSTEPTAQKVPTNGEGTGVDNPKSNNNLAQQDKLKISNILKNKSHEKSSSTQKKIL